MGEYNNSTSFNLIQNESQMQRDLNSRDFVCLFTAFLHSHLTETDLSASAKVAQKMSQWPCPHSDQSCCHPRRLLRVQSFKLLIPSHMFINNVRPFPTITCCLMSSKDFYKEKWINLFSVTSYLILLTIHAWCRHSWQRKPPKESHCKITRGHWPRGYRSNTNARELSYEERLKQQNFKPGLSPTPKLQQNVNYFSYWERNNSSTITKDGFTSKYLVLS